MSAAVQVITLRAGECFNMAAISERGAPWRVKSYPAGAALLIHPHFGPTLFDTGYGEAAVQAMSRWPGLLYGLATPVRLDPRETVLAQIRRLGFEETDIRQIILSHLHADHVGGLRDFPSAALWLDGRAYQPLRLLGGVRAVRKAFLPELLPADFEARLRPVQFQPAPPMLAPFDESADIFGDGSVLALPVPGHAPGMIALLARTRSAAPLEGSDGTGWVLLAADAAWSVQALRENRPIHPLGRIIIHDLAAERSSAERIRALLKRYPRLAVIVSHDVPERVHV